MPYYHIYIYIFFFVQRIRTICIGNAHMNNGIVAPNYNLEFNMTRWSRVSALLAERITLIWSCVCSRRHVNILKMKFLMLTATGMGLFICEYSTESNGFNSQIIFGWNYLPMRIGCAVPSDLRPCSTKLFLIAKNRKYGIVEYAVEIRESIVCSTNDMKMWEKK